MMSTMNTQRSTQLTVRVPIDLYEALRSLSYATDSSMNEITLRALGSYLSEQGHRDAVEAAGRSIVERYQGALHKLADL